MNTLNDCKVTQTQETINVTTNKINFTYRLTDRVYDVEFLSSPYAPMKNVGFEFRYQNKLYTRQNVNQGEPEITVEEGKSCFGAGVHVEVKHHFGELIITQAFELLTDTAYFITQLIVRGKDFIKSNYMSPLQYAGEVFSLKGTKTPRLLYVPYDNDKWIRYKAQEMQECGISYELTAVYDDDTRNGYVVGSVSHDQWKTGIKTHGGYGELSFFSIYGGVADPTTRDEAMPHGEVRGVEIKSPMVFAGYYEDFRLGLIDYGKANDLVCPKLPWNEGVPFGWNSWACLTTNVSFEAYTKTSEVLYDLADNGFINEGTVYVNFDSFWDRLTPEELVESVKIVHSRGQKAGFYYTPFTCWSGNFDRYVEHTNKQYTYRDIILRDANDNPLPPIAGGYPIDPTHPGNLMRVAAMMRYIVELGFDYLKVDFMSHGSCEGVHYLRDITTGIESYNYGLKHMLGLLDQKVTGRNIFVDFSIAPVFPYCYAHSRRISCDVFGQIYDTEYMLNSLTYGFWQHDTIYRFNDPDHTCLYKSVGRPVSDFDEAQSRLNASVIAGTVLLLSDDYRDEKALERTKKLLNPKLLSIAKEGGTFLPLETATLDRASRMFERVDRDTIYLAVFNCKDAADTITVDTSRMSSLPENAVFRSLDGYKEYTGNILSIELNARQSVILECKR
ncbi:MAG: hypothetical protein K0S76_1970 [Herbinix sp.]|jgi:hypothetical protein|nr:hypothetical protein [Herbinix sp.]